MGLAVVPKKPRVTNQVAFSNTVEINKEEVVLNKQNVVSVGGWVANFQQSVSFSSELMSTTCEVETV